MGYRMKAAKIVMLQAAGSGDFTIADGVELWAEEACE
jgi:hypothetical protein